MAGKINFHTELGERYNNSENTKITYMIQKRRNIFELHKLKNNVLITIKDILFASKPSFGYVRYIYIYMVRLHQNGPNDGFTNIILSSYFSLKVMVASSN